MADCSPTSENNQAGSNGNPKKGGEMKNGTAPKLPMRSPKALDVIHVHRLMIGGMMQDLCSQRYVTTLSVNPSIEPPKSVSSIFRRKEPSDMKLKPISLNEMAEDEDRVYKRRLLRLTLTEDPMMGFTTSINSVGQDEEGTIERVAIYNAPANEQFRQLLAFGTQLGIISPYHRMAADGGAVIRVDDPSQIIHYGRKENMCRYCGKDDSRQFCAKCGVQYCSRDCQLADWKDMKHKKICKKRN